MHKREAIYLSSQVFYDYNNSVVVMAVDYVALDFHDT